MRFVQCKKCKKVYPGSLKKCPDCQTKTPISKTRLVFAIFLIIFGVSILFASISGMSESESDYEQNKTLSSSETVSQTADSVKEKKGEVNYENFEKIENGMTYQQVVELFGCEGKIMSETDIGLGEEYKTTLYYWYDDTGVSNCNVTIQGGKVVAKAQIGLR